MTSRSPGAAGDRLDPAGVERLTREVADFYDRLVFPSRSSHDAYRAFLPDRSGERIADFGCGQSLFHEALRAHSPPPTFLDISRAALRTIDYGCRVRADLRRLPFPAASYDRILCIGVIHHLPDPRAALAEIARVMRPGARLFLGVYAPGTANARLRRLHDASPRGAWRIGVALATSGLLALGHLAQGRVLGAADLRRRTDDFLKVPFVRYAAPEEWIAEAEQAGLTRRAVHRISAMNVLELERF
jgi:SAM-dependent methyltransferase